MNGVGQPDGILPDPRFQSEGIAAPTRSLTEDPDYAARRC